MSKMTIKPVNATEFTVEGSVTYHDGTFYCGGDSYPAEIVVRVE